MSDSPASLRSKPRSRGSRSSKKSRSGGDPCCRLRVVLLGDTCVGKTSILRRFVKGTFDPHVSRTTFFDEMEKEVVVDDQRCVLHLVDTCGGERFKTLRENFYRGTHICLLTFALDSLASFCNLTMWREEFLYYSDIPVGHEFPFLVLGNKADLPERAISDLNVQAWCRANGDVPYIETSAKQVLNVEEVFVAGVRRFREVQFQNAAPWRAEESRAGVIDELVDPSQDNGGLARSAGGCCSS
ncbi:hypothetical protein ACOMHN_016844 [Nucella lapillus]